MSMGSAAHVEQAGAPSETTRVSRKIVPGRRSLLAITAVHDLQPACRMSAPASAEGKRVKIVKREKSRPARIWGCVIAAAALSGCNAAPLDSAAEDRSDGADSALAVGSLGNPGVVPPNAHPGGLSLAE